METPGTPGTAAAEPVRREGVPYLGFFLGREIYGVPLGRLREVTRVSSVRRLPGAARHIAGLANVRGEIICALDARAMLDAGAPAKADGGFLIALREFEFPVGLMVDAISDIFPIDPDAIEAVPDGWPAARAACCVGVSSVRLGFIGLLDVDRMVNG